MSGIPHRTHLPFAPRAGHHPSVADRVLDPRGRVLLLFSFAVVVVSLSRIPVLLVALTGGVILAVVFRIPWGEIGRKILAVDLFMVSLLLVLPFVTPGTPLFTIGSVSGSREGLEKAVVILLKANAIFLALSALVGGMEATRLGHALALLGMPDKVVHLFLFTVRYIEVLGREFRRLKIAMTARAFVPATNWHTWRAMGYLFAMLLVRSLERAERILQAMKCRGFSGRFHLIATFSFSRGDALFALLGAGYLLVLLYLEWWPWNP